MASDLGASSSARADTVAACARCRLRSAAAAGGPRAGILHRRSQARRTCMITRHHRRTRLTPRCRLRARQVDRRRRAEPRDERKTASVGRPSTSWPRADSAGRRCRAAHRHYESWLADVRAASPASNLYTAQSTAVREWRTSTSQPEARREVGARPQQGIPPAVRPPGPQGRWPRTQTRRWSSAAERWRGDFRGLYGEPTVTTHGGGGPSYRARLPGARAWARARSTARANSLRRSDIDAFERG